MQFKKISDIYRLQNQKKQTYARIGQMLVDITRKKQANYLNEDMNISFMYKVYHIEPRTLKKHLKTHFFNIGRTKYFSLTNDEYNIIIEMLDLLKKFNSMGSEYQKLIKFIVYSQIVGTTANGGQ